MNGKTNGSTRFTRARAAIKKVAKARGYPLDQGENSGRSRNQNRRPTRQREKHQLLGQDPRIRGERSTSNRTYRTNGLPVVTLHHDVVRCRIQDFAKLSKKLFADVPFRKNTDIEFKLPSVKPPRMATGADEHGQYVTLIGSEALFPLSVRTASSVSAPPTSAGDILAQIALHPVLLPNTRLNLLCANYTKWLPIHIRVQYIPLSSATQSGALVATPSLDPGDVIGIGGGPESRVARSMDYEDSRTYNIYNNIFVDFPELALDVDPFYLKIGEDARLEIPYILTIMAQTGYSAENFEQFRNVGWFILHYEVRVYEDRLPNFTPTITNTVLSLDAPTMGIVYHLNITGDPENTRVTGVATWWWYGLSLPDTGYCQYIILDDIRSNTPLTWGGEDIQPFVPSKGSVFYGHLITINDPTFGVTTAVAFSASVASLFNGDYLTWAETPDILAPSDGILAVTFFDLTQTL